MSYSKEDVKEQLTIDDICALLEEFDAEPELVGDHIIARTICHNTEGEGSRKLYYYENTQLFNCYTHCGAFDVFELVQKVKHIDDLNDSVYWIVNFFNLQNYIEDANEIDYNNEDWKVLKAYERINNIEVNDEYIQLPQYDLDVIKYYPRVKIESWPNISKEVCDFAGIRYDPLHSNILIPHFDYNSRCVGIRQRTLVKEQEKFGKYRPWKHGKQLYNHALAFNLYGINWAKDRIRDIETAIIVEGEKSALAYCSFYGTANSICVATCGSNFSKYQFKMLKDLGVKEIVVAYDRDYEQVGSEEYYATEKKIANIVNKYKPYMNMSVLFDREDILGYKNSPLDCGADKFMYLFKNRIRV